MKRKMENKLDQLFRNQLSKHTEEPSAESWQQIQEMLASKRRAAWGRRLAIAASITFFVAVAFFAYRSLDVLQTGTSTEIVDVAPAQTDDHQPTSDAEVVQPTETADQQGEVVEVETSMSDRERREVTKDIVIVAAKSAEKEENGDAGTAVAEVPVLPEKSPIEPVASANEQEDREAPTVDELTPMEEALEEPSLANNTVPEKVNEDVKVPAEDRSYPRIQVVYKATKDSELVAASKPTLLSRGLDRITEFSDEHLLTADRKTKLRNTKDDLLALNFGKLLNKSNRELEN